jgi:hypothetical protein
MQRSALYEVVAPIPEIGAVPGDYLHVQPWRDMFPLELTRFYDRGSLPIVRDERVRLVSLDGEPAPSPQLALELPSDPGPETASPPRPLADPASAEGRWSRRHLPPYLRLVG